MGDTRINYKMVTTNSGYYRIKLETQDKKQTEIMYLEDQEDDLTTYNAIGRVHEVKNHKGEHQLINAYSKAGWICPKVLDDINRVLLNCKICQEFAKSVSRPKVILPKSNLFNKVVTLDLKTFGSKHILWMSG